MAEHPAPPVSTTTSAAAGSAEAAPRTGPLHGLRVLDLTAVVLGPLATQILGDMGADIIKVEGLEGDLMRANGVSRHAGMSSIFLAINRNKRSVAIDLKSDEGRRTIERLIATVDIVVHNMRVPAIERLGLGYEAVRAIKPDIVYCVATGFGQDGPYRHKPAFDDIIQAACGLAGLIGGIAGKPDYVPTLLADKVCGILLANAVLAATVHHARTGQGQYVEVPMLESMTAFTLAEHLGGLTFDPATAPPGYARILGTGRKPAPTSDGYIAMLPYTARHWEAFFEMAGRPELAEKYQVADRFARNRHVADLYRDMHAITRQRTTAEWLRVCEELDIPASPVRGLADLLDDEHLQAVGLFEHSEHPTEGAIRAVRPTTLFSETPAAVRRPAPTLGQDTDDILREAGLSDAQIRALKDKGVLRGAPAATPTAASASASAASSASAPSSSGARRGALGRLASLAALAGAAALGGRSSPARAQSPQPLSPTAIRALPPGDFPGKPIRIIVPFAAGSGSDTGSRFYGEQLSRLLGQPVLVENRPGGSGLVAIQAVKSAPADGHTIMLASNSPMTVNPVVMKSLPYDPFKDFRPVVGIARGAVGFITSGQSPYKTIREIVDDSRRTGRPLTIGTYSAGYQLVAAWLQTVTGAQITNVAYKGGAQIFTDLIGGQLDLGAVDFGGAAPMVKDGRIRALAMTADRRHRDFPDVPTMRDSGYPDFETYVWSSLYVRAETPDDITTKLVEAMQAVMASAESRDYMATQPAEPMAYRPDAMERFQRAEFERFKRVAAAANIQPQ